jgi:heterodisulfide reductase subunit C
MVGGHAIVTFLADPQADDYSVWLCSSCWRCTEACPSGVDIHCLMMAARRRQPAPAWYQASFECVLATGQALEVSQADLNALRSDHGLEQVRLAPGRLAARLLRGDD